MKMFTSVPDVFLYRDAVDFRKSINGLAVIVRFQDFRDFKGSVQGVSQLDNLWKYYYLSSNLIEWRVYLE